MADGFVADFLGVRTRRSFFEQNEFLAPLYEESGRSGGPHASPKFPAFNEDYFEWVALLEAVVQAHGHFVMIELGAGYGRWLVRARVAARSRGLRCRLIGVEAEPTHFEWLKQHVSDNELSPNEVQLVNAAVSSRDGMAWFLLTSPVADYGQRIVLPEELPALHARGASLHQVNTVSLATLLAPLQQVDLIDLDVQGEELRVLEAAQEVVDQRVRYVHIGTHNHEVEAGHRQLFGDTLRWACTNDYPCGGTSNTPWGPIAFQDGVQDWRNTKIG